VGDDADDDMNSHDSSVPAPALLLGCQQMAATMHAAAVAWFRTPMLMLMLTMTRTAIPAIAHRWHCSNQTVRSANQAGAYGPPLRHPLTTACGSVSILSACAPSRSLHQRRGEGGPHDGVVGYAAGKGLDGTRAA